MVATVFTVTLIAWFFAELSLASYTYMGCYVGDYYGALDDVHHENKTASVLQCYRFCRRNYKYFGLANITCVCDNDGYDQYESFSPAGNETVTCELQCDGENNQICGGRWALSVYSIDDTPPPTQVPTLTPTPTPTLSPTVHTSPTNVTYLGCYADDHDRALDGSSEEWSLMDVTECLFFCSMRSYKYFGVQFSTKCYCGNYGFDRYRDSIPTSEEACDLPCRGDKNQICGGRFANSVFTIHYGTRDGSSLTTYNVSSCIQIA